MKTITSSILANLIPKLAGVRSSQRLSILIYHRVVASSDYMLASVPTTDEFDWQMELLAHYFNPLSLSHALQLMDKGNLPENAVCVTFDDGYADNASLALPILKKWNIPATVFVSTDFLNGGRMWNDTVIESVRTCQLRELNLEAIGLGRYSLDSQESRKKSAFAILDAIKYLPSPQRQRAVELVEESAGDLPIDLMLSSEQLQLLHTSGIEIGAHTKSHPILAELGEKDAREEILGSRQILEELLGEPIKYFAYPNGKPGADYQSLHHDIIKEAGFSAALSTQWGVSSRESDRWQMARFTPWDKSPLRFLVRLLLNQRSLVL